MLIQWCTQKIIQDKNSQQQQLPDHTWSCNNLCKYICWTQTSRLCQLKSITFRQRRTVGFAVIWWIYMIFVRFEFGLTKLLPTTTSVQVHVWIRMWLDENLVPDQRMFMDVDVWELCVWYWSNVLIKTVGSMCTWCNNNSDDFLLNYLQTHSLCLKSFFMIYACQF